jgi:hypothetical protein
MNDNKLKEQIKELLPNVNVTKMGNKMAATELYSLIEDVACEFVKWHEGLTMTQMFDLPTADNFPYPTFNDAFQYFIQNIYKQKEVE